MADIKVTGIDTSSGQKVVVEPDSAHSIKLPANTVVVDGGTEKSIVTTDPSGGGVADPTLLAQGSADPGKIIIVDGSGIPTWMANLIHVENTTGDEIVLTVGKGGDTHYTSVKAAVEFATTIGTAAAPVLVLVYPGYYYEDPFTIGQYVRLKAASENSAIIIANDPDEHLVTSTGSIMWGIAFDGVKNPAKACVYNATPGFPTVLFNPSFTNCSIGVLTTGGAQTVFINAGVVIDSYGENVETVFKVNGSSQLIGSGFFASVPPALLTYYRRFADWNSGTSYNPGTLVTSPHPLNPTLDITWAAIAPSTNVIPGTDGGSVWTVVAPAPAATVNPLDRLFDVSGSSTVLVKVGNMDINFQPDVPNDLIFLDDSSKLDLIAVDLRNSHTALHIGSVGTSEANVQSCTIEGFIKNFKIDSATSIVHVNSQLDELKADLVAGSKVEGLITETDEQKTSLIGEVNYKFENNKVTPFSELIAHKFSTGVQSGGLVLKKKHTFGSNYTSAIDGVSGNVRITVATNNFKVDMVGHMFHDESSGIQVEVLTFEDSNNILIDSTSLTDYNGGSYEIFDRNNVIVEAGTGWIHDHINDPHYGEFVMWNEETVPIARPVSGVKTYYVCYQGATGTIAAVADSMPSADENIILGSVIATPERIKFTHNLSRSGVGLVGIINDYLGSIHRVLVNSGLGVSQGSTNRKINIDGGSYWINLTKVTYPGETEPHLHYYYGLTNQFESIVTNIDITNRQTLTASTDPNDGVTPLTASYRRVDTLFLTSDHNLTVVMGATEFPDTVNGINDAILEAPASPPVFIEDSAIALATLIVQQGNGITHIIDQRPRVNANTTSNSVSDHGQLTGLSDDDHTLYLLVNGNRSMGGTLQMGTNNITFVGSTGANGLVDGVKVSDHSDRHLPGGVDALPIGTPSTIGASNDAGNSNDFARGNHSHSHGNLGGGATHAAAVASSGGVGGSNGFIRATDQEKLNTATASATANTLVIRDGSGAAVFSGLTVGSLSGVIKATAGVLSGSATTDDLTEGSNLYYTNERVDDRVAALIQNGSGIDWTYVDGSGTLTGNLTDTGVSANTYGSASSVAQFTVDAKGRISSASNISITAPAGALTGTTLASNVVTSSLTAVGTISTGTWSATTIAANKGGTGQTSYAVGDVLYADTTSTLAKLSAGTSGQVITSNGAGAAPSYQNPMTVLYAEDLVSTSTSVTETTMLSATIVTAGTYILDFTSLLTSTTNNAAVATEFRVYKGATLLYSLPVSFKGSASPGTSITPKILRRLTGLVASDVIAVKAIATNTATATVHSSSMTLTRIS